MGRHAVGSRKNAFLKNIFIDYVFLHAQLK